MIVGCLCLYDEDFEEALEGIKSLRPYVKRYIVVIDESVSAKQRKLLEGFGCEVHLHRFEDDFVAMKNTFIAKCEVGDWIVTHDGDEFFNEQFCLDLFKICKQGEKDGTDIFLLNSHDVLHHQDGTTTEEPSWFYKKLLYRKKKSTAYVAKGEVPKVHEDLAVSKKTRMVRLDPENYWYRHVKSWHKIWARAAMNMFIGGGGSENMGKANVQWELLRQICDSLGLKRWAKMREYLKKGNISPMLKSWLWINRFDGAAHQREMMELGLWYFHFLHPREADLGDGRKWAMTPLEEGSRLEVARYVADCYNQVLGRDPDVDGQNHYTEQIVTRRIKREDLVNILKASEEYKLRVGDEA